jgi:hypothetical protein
VFGPGLCLFNEIQNVGISRSKSEISVQCFIGNTHLALISLTGPKASRWRFIRDALGNTKKARYGEDFALE